MSDCILASELTDIENLTPNQLDDPKTRLRKAKAWLKEFPEESTSTAAKIFKIHRSTLSNSLHRVTNPSHGGYNRVLTHAQEHVIEAIIQGWLAHGQEPNRAVLFSAISKLRLPLPPPSEGWFRRWWNKKGLRALKPLDKAVQQSEPGETAFHSFAKELQEET